MQFTCEKVIVTPNGVRFRNVTLEDGRFFPWATTNSFQPAISVAGSEDRVWVPLDFDIEEFEHRR